MTLKIGLLGRIWFVMSFILLFSFCVDQKKSLFKFVDAPLTWYSKELVRLNELKPYEQAMEYEKSIVVLKNESTVLPFRNLNTNISLLAIGGESTLFKDGMELFTNLSAIQVPSANLLNDSQFDSLKSSNYVILSMHATNKTIISDSLNESLIKRIPKSSKRILVVFGSSDFVNSIDPDLFDAIVLGHENHQIAQNEIAQLLFGAIGTNAKIKERLKRFPIGTGMEIKSNNRLKFSSPEEVGIDSYKLKKIDEIALNGIKTGAYPGCQIVAAVDNKIIYRKSFGTHTYENPDKLVKNEDLYDIASITKIAASTLLAMHLNWKNEFNLDKSLREYIPNVTEKTSFGSIIIREMMAHQAGLTPFIPFYKRTLKNGSLNPEIYSNTEKVGFELKVADGIYMNQNYVDSIYKQILATPLGVKKYEYSDLCYYFTQKILEKQIGKRQDLFLLENIYKPMGLRYARYLPLNYFDKSQIVPTERDMAFRKQLLHGTVHDPGAAMLGGVAGHAGLFCNATDLASIMQLFLNKGSYGGMQFFDEETTDEFTKQQFPGNRRGAGFDRPNASGGGTCDNLASPQSYGHSGFTGTLAWADPKDKVIFVFLSNRVHPDQENWKLRDMGIRTQIQHVVYEAVQARKK